MYCTNPLFSVRWLPEEWNVPIEGLTAEIAGRKTRRLHGEKLVLLDCLRFAVVPRTVEDIVNYAEQRHQISTSIAVDGVEWLYRNDLLIDDDQRYHDLTEWVQEGWQNALLYHQASKRTIEKTETDTGSEVVAREQNDEERQPIPLPEPNDVSTASLEEILIERRTCRDFYSEPISLQTLSDIFHIGLSMHGELCLNRGGTETKAVTVKETPSFCHYYLYAPRVTGLSLGVYKYKPEDHSVFLLDDGYSSASAIDEEVAELIVGQRHAVGSAFTLFFTVDTRRFQAQRPTTSGFREVHTLQSMIAQNVLLASTAAELGVFQTAAFEDSDVADALGVEKGSEIAVYVVSIGRKAER